MAWFFHGNSRELLLWHYIEFLLGLFRCCEEVLTFCWTWLVRQHDYGYCHKLCPDCLTLPWQLPCEIWGQLMLLLEKYCRISRTRFLLSLWCHALRWRASVGKSLVAKRQQKQWYADTRRKITPLSCLKSPEDNTTWIASVKACPKWRLPVTFGGGNTITNLSFSPSMDGLKYPDSSHHEYLRFYVSNHCTAP